MSNASGKQAQNIGVSIILLTGDKTSILMGERINSYLSGFFGIPGGRVNVGEPLVQAARRELEEETGLRATSLELLGVTREMQENSYDFIDFSFLCSEFEGEPVLKEPEKCKGWGWVSLNKLPEKIIPVHISAIEFYKKSLNASAPFFKDFEEK